ncbi:MAG: hypothetical protein JSW33_02675 [bacterium]|nr:MAG: hypothetical protein JSW33_02675 [bacterium]
MRAKTITSFALVLVLFASPVFSSPIDNKHRELRSLLGRPIGAESRCAHNPKGRYRHYQKGTIYWHPDTGAHEVHGVIRDKYRSLKEYWGVLGFPVTDQKVTPDKIGHFNHFQHGSIYWTTYTGAHEVHGAIRAKWASEGWERNWIGYPESDEMDTPDGGRYSRFQRGYIVWTPESGAKVIGYGALVDKTDPDLDFAKLDRTHCGDLKEFYLLMKKWYGIDLREGVIRDRKTKKIIKNIKGWQFADFWNDNKLNGKILTERERLVITVAELLLMQWHLRDLQLHDKLRRNQIDRYFKSPHGFKRNWSSERKEWSYNDWCSEFVSYAYKRAGTPVYLKKRQSFVSDRGARKLKAYEDLGWCMSRVEYFRGYFRKRNRFFPIADIRNKKRGAPQLGDYLCTEPHSMLVLGFDRKEQEIYIVEGNGGGKGKPEGRIKRVLVGWYPLAAKPQSSPPQNLNPWSKMIWEMVHDTGGLIGVGRKELRHN